MIKKYKHQKSRRVVRTRSRILSGTKMEFKLAVNKSNKYIWAQVVNLKTGDTVVAARSKKADEAGMLIAEKAKKAKIEKVVFDRGAYKYHGRIKQLADAARKGGLKF